MSTNPFDTTFTPSISASVPAPAPAPISVKPSTCEIYKPFKEGIVCTYKGIINVGQSIGTSIYNFTSFITSPTGLWLSFIIILIIVIIFLVLRKNRVLESYENPNQLKLINETGDKIGMKHLLLFYRPDCVHCHNFMDSPDSIWKQFVEKYKQHPYVKITTIDGSKKENEDILNKYNVAGFPTIIKVVDDSVVEYKGDRTFEDLEHFIA